MNNSKKEKDTYFPIMLGVKVPKNMIIQLGFAKCR